MTPLEHDHPRLRKAAEIFIAKEMNGGFQERGVRGGFVGVMKRGWFRKREETKGIDNMDEH